MGTCIGKCNYKAFVLSLLHGFILTSMMVYHAYGYWSLGYQMQMNWVMYSIFWIENVALASANIFVTCMLLVHSLLIAINVTGIERKKGTPLYHPGLKPADAVLSTQVNIYDLGTDQNCASVFGDHPLWFCWPYGDGREDGHYFHTIPLP